MVYGGYPDRDSFPRAGQILGGRLIEQVEHVGSHAIRMQREIGRGLSDQQLTQLIDRGSEQVKEPARHNLFSEK